MKKFIVLTALVMSCAAFALDAVRVDVQGVADMRISKVAGEKLSVGTTPAKAEKDILRAVLISGNLNAEWQKFEMSFVPEKNGRVTLRFHTPGSRNIKSIKPVLLDDVQCTGGTLLNGDFEILNNGVLTNWRLGSAGKLITGENVYHGKQCVQVFFNSGMAVQTIFVTAGEKVTISFRARIL